MSKRAARGAGLDWGLAEETGKAIRWLSACNLPGAEALAKVLLLNQNKKYEELAPDSTEDTWSAPSGRLCPLICGSTMSDLSEEIAQGKAITLRSVVKPLILLGYLVHVTKQTQKSVRLSWTQAELMVSSAGITLRGENTDALYANDVQCNVTESSGEFTPFGVIGREVEDSAWQTLTDFMTRYLAPNTDESRLVGAGAGFNDND